MLQIQLATKEKSRRRSAKGNQRQTREVFPSPCLLDLGLKSRYTARGVPVCILLCSIRSHT